MFKTSEGKFVLFDRATGEQREFWPIDAMVLLDAGTHSADPPAGVTPKVPDMPPRHVGASPPAVAATFVAPESDAGTKSAKAPKKQTAEGG